MNPEIPVPADIAQEQSKPVRKRRITDTVLPQMPDDQDGQVLFDANQQAKSTAPEESVIITDKEMAAQAKTTVAKRPKDIFTELKMKKDDDETKNWMRLNHKTQELRAEAGMLDIKLGRNIDDEVAEVMRRKGVDINSLREEQDEKHRAKLLSQRHELDRQINTLLGEMEKRGKYRAPIMKEFLDKQLEAEVDTAKESSALVAPASAGVSRLESEQPATGEELEGNFNQAELTEMGEIITHQVKEQWPEIEAAALEVLDNRIDSLARVLADKIIFLSMEAVLRKHKSDKFSTQELLGRASIMADNFARQISQELGGDIIRRVKGEKLGVLDHAKMWWKQVRGQNEAIIADIKKRKMRKAQEKSEIFNPVGLAGMIKQKMGLSGQEATMQKAA